MSPSPSSRLGIVLAKLRGVKPIGDGYQACCPTHDDKHPSLSIKETPDGRILILCHASPDVCTFSRIAQTLDLPESYFAPPVSGSAPSARSAPRPRTFSSRDAAVRDITARLVRDGYEHKGGWAYCATDGHVAFVILRFEHPTKEKTFRQIKPIEGGWTLGLPQARPLYRSPELLTSDDIVVVEGEKAADAAAGIGLAATTSVGGSGQARHSDWSVLAAKRVAVIPDNDAPGLRYARDVRAILADLTPAPIVRVVTLPGLPEHGDIVEFISACRAQHMNDGAIRSKVESLINASPVLNLDFDSNSIADPPPEPFPTHVFPPPVRDYVRAVASGIPCDDAFAALPALASLSVCIGNSARAKLKQTWQAPAVIWVIVVAESGTGKSPAARAVLAPLDALEEELRREHAEKQRQFDSEHAKWEAEFGRRRQGRRDDVIRPEPPKAPILERITTDDVTIEALVDLLAENPRGLAVIRDEGAGWLAGFDRYAKSRGAEVPKWLEVYDARSIQIDRKTAAKRHTYVPMAFVTVFAGIQPAVLRDALQAPLINNGFFARLLIAQPPRQPKVWRRDDTVPESYPGMLAVLRRLRRLEPFYNDLGEPTPRAIALNEDAYERWVNLYTDFALEQHAVSGPHTALLAKIEGVVPRFALILHLADLASAEDLPETLPPISLSAMERAIELAMWFKRQGEALLRTLLPADAAAVEILRGKIAEGFFDQPRTARDVGRQRWRGMTSAVLATPVLDSLVADGELVAEPSPPGPGRRTILYRRPSAPDGVPESPDPTTEVGSAEQVDPDAIDDRRIDETPPPEPRSAWEAAFRVMPWSLGFVRGPNGVTKPCQEPVHV